MQQLIGEIVNDLFPAGTFLPGEVELVERFGVSRGVVRECLRGLEERRMVAVRHGKGAQVLSPDDWDVFDSSVFAAVVESPRGTGLLSEYLECRKLLEVQGAALAAQRATPSRLRDLEVSYQRLSTIAQQQRGDRQSDNDYHDADIGFHSALAAASGNRALARLVYEIHRSLLPRQILARPDRRRDEILSEHERILVAVRNGDERAAAAAMAAHLGAVERYLGTYEAAQASAQDVWTTMD